MTQGRPINWTPKMDSLLGTMSNPDVADLLGISATAVNLRRRKLGIPAFSRSVQWTSEMEAQLGTISDPKVADKLGISEGAVRRRRENLSIPSWRSKIPRHNRRHLVEGLANTLTYEQWLFACEWFDQRCAYCGEKRFLTEDHLVPVSKGGPRTALNIIPSCWECNYSKRARQAHLWIYEHFGMTQGEEIVKRIVTYLTGVGVQCSG